MRRNSWLDGPAVLLASWRSYGVAFGCPNTETLVKFGTTRNLRKLTEKLKKILMEKVTLPLEGNRKLVLVDVDTITISIIHLKLAEGRDLKQFRKLVRGPNTLLRRIVLACWNEPRPKVL